MTMTRLRRQIRRRIASDRGAVLAEFAVLVPVLVTLLFGVIQMSIAFNRHQAVHAAAREGARVASLPTSSTADACARVQTALTGINFQNTPSCTVTGSCSGGSANVQVVVSAEHTVNLAMAGTRSLTITGTGDFRCE